MSALVLDSGALIAVERDDRRMALRIAAARRHGDAFRTNAMIVAQVWRDPRGRQAKLARFLHGVDVQAVTPAMGRATGLLLNAAGTDDPVDASLVLIARDGDRVFTSDPEDMEHLVRAAGLHVHVVAC